jgi:hypothetical protein
MNLKYGGRMWTVIIWFRSGTGGGVFELDNETSGSITNRKFFDQLRDYKLLKNDSSMN